MHTFHATRLLRLVPLAALAFGRPALAESDTPRTPPVGSGLEQAMEHYERCGWAQAYGALVPLADAGDREAARIALLMRAHGSRLFGHTFAASPSQREHWLAVARPPFEAE
jgi:hypothetical protein